MCLVIKAILAELKNGKMNGTETGLGDVWGLDNSLLD